MKKYFAVLGGLFILTGISSFGHAEDKSKATTAKIEMLDDEVMEKLTKAAEPTEQHQLLSALAGRWYYEVRYWTKEGADPQISTGITTNEMILGGRYLLTKTSLILNVGGQNIPYEGHGMLGYNPVENTFTSVWADSMHTGFVTSNGQYNEKSKTIEEKGSFTHPLMAGRQAYRSTLQFTDDGTYKRTFFITGKSGREFKAVEITYERR